MNIKERSLFICLSLVIGILYSPLVISDSTEQDFETSTSTSENIADLSWYEKNAGFTKPSNKEIKKRLTSLQYRVTQKDATERPFKNEYWDNKRAGIYVDIVSGEPLFSSTDKYKSGTGWPSFTRPIRPDAMKLHEDRKLFFSRTELRSSKADSHLGHVFEDGPKPTGLRYCINSASLRFVPKEALAKEGYVEFISLFE